MIELLNVDCMEYMATGLLFIVGLFVMRIKRAKVDDLAERRAVAKVFNDRYCYRVQYEENAERLTGTAAYCILPRSGNRWMCPECNRIHAPTECSLFTGIQYPACCNTASGNRLNHGVRIS